MKIASDYYQKGLGKSLGFLVGALVLGTAFPHLVKSVSVGFSWKYVVFATSTISVLGGLMMLLFVPNGPFRKPSQQLNFNAFLSGFKNKNFRSAAIGYFGHMWELYAVWTWIAAFAAAGMVPGNGPLTAPMLGHEGGTSRSPEPIGRTRRTGCARSVV
jgi:predicted MFS family arabinose efflux permease